jgi:hypothetical protein
MRKVVTIGSGVSQSHQRAVAWGEWLNTKPWTHIAALTFREPRSAEAALAAARAFLKRISESAPSGIIWFAAVEPGDCCRSHVHALLGFVPSEAVSISFLQRGWRCGWSRVNLFNPGRRGAHYVTKQMGLDTTVWDCRLEYK